MSKVLKTAATIIGVTAAIVATAGALAPAATASFLGGLGVTAGTVAGTTALATTLAGVSALASVASGLSARKPPGEPPAFAICLNPGVPQ